MTEIDEKKIFDIIQKAKDSGKIKIGINQVTKDVERKQAKLVVYANDVSPKEIVMHVPMLCREMDVLCYEVGTKAELGSLCGVKSASSICVIEEGEAKSAIESLKKEKDTKKEDKSKAKEEKVEETSTEKTKTNESE